MKKLFIIFLIAFSFSSFLKADYLLLNLERCAKDYYYGYDNGIYKLFYLNSRTGNWNKTTTNVGSILPGYVFDSVNEVCLPPEISNELGIHYHEYKFLMGLMGLLVGFSWLFPFLHIFSRR